MAEQIAREILGADVAVGGPAPLPDPATLRLGISATTPVHAHVAAVLRAMPGLAARHGVSLALSTWDSGKAQGEAVADGSLDAFFSCEVPAIRMLESRPDAWVVGSPGVLGRIAVLGRGVGTLRDLAGRRVGLVPGSTPAMDWEAWAREAPGAEVVPLATDALLPALAEGRVDAIVGWDPWIARGLAEIPGATVLAERPFRSVLAVGARWVADTEADGGTPPAARVTALVAEALAIAARDRPRWDAAAAALSGEADASGGWSLDEVRAVADLDPLLAPCDVRCAADNPAALGLGEADLAGLTRAAAWTRAPFVGRGVDGSVLLRGVRPPPRAAGASPGGGKGVAGRGGTPLPAP
jgi:ABC-type nitrate/sulfonate/bicarbonate transport system substrate-binding protein